MSAHNSLLNSNDSSHLTYPDLIRVVGCLIVFSYHFALAFSRYGISANVDMFYQWRGFNLVMPAIRSFLMVSGAVLMLRYGSGEFHPGQYYRKRFLGFFPYFYLDYVIAAMIFFWIQGQISTAPKYTLVLTLLGLDSYFSLLGVNDFALIGEWFSGILLIMYLLFPLVLWLSKKKVWLPTLLLLIGSLLLVLFHPFGDSFDTSILINLMYFSLGMLVQKLMMVGKEREENGSIRPGSVATTKHILGGISLVILIGQLLIAACNPAGLRQYLASDISIFLRVLAFYFCLIEIDALLDLISGKHLVISLRRGLRALSKYTLQIYLIHHMCIFWYLSHFADSKQSGSSVLTMYLTLMAGILAASMFLDWMAKWIIRKLQSYHRGA